jgi:uncharacterized membrane protein YozB (DUF420 family)
MAWTEYLPTVNAILNAVSTCLIVSGFLAVITGRINLHKTCMLSAFVVSSLFLASYVYYHIVVREGKETYFVDQAPDAPEWVGRFYRRLLISHVLLAIVAAPLVITTVILGLRNCLVWHRRLARWTLPIWLYVSVTGVVVYWMLYRLYASP